ncbi:MAG: hypothetical protein O3C27_10140 [Actinomycetota bacterium]|nr:hypothetical protein [Actinomycetota bacterium]
MFELIDQRSESGSCLPVPYGSVTEAKPDVVYLVDGEREVRYSDAFVSGAVVDVVAGRGFSSTFEDDVETRIEHDPCGCPKLGRGR